MKEIGLGLAGLGMLYLTRRKMTLELGRLVRRFGGSERAFLIVWSAVFLPGTIIHEVSHFLAAALTGARTGRVEIFPELPRKTLGSEGSDLARVDKRSDPSGVHRLGFVETQRLGPVRGFLVGVAPLVVGLGILVWISSAGGSGSGVSCLASDRRLLVCTLRIYLFFTVANSLFLSCADVKQALPLVVIAAILGGGMYFLGIRPEIIPDSRLILLLTSLWKAVWISAGVNLAAVILLWGTNALTKRRRSSPDS